MSRRGRRSARGASRSSACLIKSLIATPRLAASARKRSASLFVTRAATTVSVKCGVRTCKQYVAGCGVYGKAVTLTPTYNRVALVRLVEIPRAFKAHVNAIGVSATSPLAFAQVM